MEKNKRDKLEVCGCPTHGKKAIHKEVICWDVNDTVDFWISWCNDCISEENKEEAIAEAMYWKNLSDKQKVPDLKYWTLEYDWQSGWFTLVVPDIEEPSFAKNRDYKLPERVWYHIDPKDLAKVVGDKKKFKYFIAKHLKEMAGVFKVKRSRLIK